MVAVISVGSFQRRSQSSNDKSQPFRFTCRCRSWEKISRALRSEDMPAFLVDSRTKSSAKRRQQRFLARPGGIPSSFITDQSIVRGTLSKAFWKSTKQQWSMFPLALAVSINTSKSDERGAI